MALYAFDGTWNKNQTDNRKDTNVRKFYDAYGSSKKEKWYVPGPGTRFGMIGSIIGGLTGAGGETRVQEAYKALQNKFREGDQIIDIVGFSRGAALAVDFANLIADKGVHGKPAAEIRFLGLWDVVASFGLPGNELNFGYKLEVPKNVRHCFHALALDERRWTFRPERLAQPGAGERICEVWFRGVHSDIGGGNKERGLTSITLHWMFKQAARCGLAIAPQSVAAEANDMQPGTAIYSNKMDLVKNDFRAVGKNDLVHQSVGFRGKQGGTEFNNPPEGCPIVGDDSMTAIRKFKRN